MGVPERMEVPTGRTNFWNCGRMVRRSTFNRDGESSILSSSTNETICRRRLVVRIADLQSADGSSILLAGTNQAHRRESVVRA